MAPAGIEAVKLLSGLLIASDKIEPRRRSLSAIVATNTTLLVLGRVVIALSGLLGVAVATRYLGRDTFGELTVAFGFVSILTTLTDLGIWTVTARELAKRPEEEQRILSNSLTLSVLLSVVAVAVGLIAMFAIYGGPGRHLVREGIVIMGSPLLVAGPAGAAVAYLTAHQRAVPAALAGTIQSVVFVVVLLTAVALDWGFTGIAVAFAAGGIVNALVPVLGLRGRVRLRFGYDRSLWKELARWAGPQAGVLVLSILYFRFDTLLLSVMTSNSEVALYGLAYKVVEVIPFLPFAFMLTLFPELARTGAGTTRLANLTQDALSSMVIAGLAVAVLVAGFAVEIVRVTGGPSFHAAVPVVRYLAVAVGLVFVNTVFFQALIALNRQMRLFVAVAGVFAVNVVLNVVLIPPLGARGSAIALVASELLVAVLVVRLYSEVGVVPRVVRPVRLVGAAAILGLAVWGVHEVPPLNHAAAWVTLLVGGAISAAVYVGALRALHAMPDELESELRRLLGSLMRRPAAPPA
jgi:O-antigen/teichoic acid export membrane protein